MMLYIFVFWEREREKERAIEGRETASRRHVSETVVIITGAEHMWTVGIWRFFFRMQSYCFFFFCFKDITWFLSRDEKHCRFQLPPAPSPCYPSLVFKERRERKKGFSALFLILLLSSQLPLLCIIQRSRLKAFTSLSDNEERRSSELY